MENKHSLPSLVLVSIINAIQLVLDLISLEVKTIWSHAHKTRFWYRLGVFCNFQISTPIIFDRGSVPGGGVKIRAVSYLLRNVNSSTYLQERVWLDS